MQHLPSKGAKGKCPTGAFWRAWSRPDSLEIFSHPLFFLRNSEHENHCCYRFVDHRIMMSSRWPILSEWQTFLTFSRM
jgi:hypothetical protein